MCDIGYRNCGVPVSVLILHISRYRNASSMVCFQAS